ncbi:hypothetical protein B0H13DRAFT_2165284 [Mycena leptocephala]|nr:hypothetical protein B0H13DRAFT_2165284 [Mycena leptocephala]
MLFARLHTAVQCCMRGVQGMCSSLALVLSPLELEPVAQVRGCGCTAHGTPTAYLGVCSHAMQRNMILLCVSQVRWCRYRVPGARAARA